MQRQGLGSIPSSAWCPEHHWEEPQNPELRVAHEHCWCDPKLNYHQQKHTVKHVAKKFRIVHESVISVGWLSLQIFICSRSLRTNGKLGNLGQHCSTPGSEITTCGFVQPSVDSVNQVLWDHDQALVLPLSIGSSHHRYC